MQQVVPHVFGTYDEAVQAVYELEKVGVAASDISMVSSASDLRMPDRVVRDSAQSPLGLGAAIGATIGGGLGLLAGLGALGLPSLITPMVNPVVAGWFFSALVGVGLGAVVGGIIGALMRLGVTDAEAHRAAQGLAKGGTVVLVRTATPNHHLVQTILNSDYRPQARQFQQLSPIVQFHADVTDEGDYADQLAVIDDQRRAPIGRRSS